MNQQSASSKTEKADALHREAIQALMAGQLHKGITLLEKALAKNPDAAPIRNDLGTAYWQSGQPAKAEVAYARALRSAPNNPFVLNSYGTFLLEQYRWHEAEPLLMRAYALKPDHYEIPNNLGLLRYRQQRTKEAGDLFLEAMRLNPRWASSYANYARVLYTVGNMEAAEKVYRHSLQLDPRHATAWSELGEVLALRQQEGEAFDYQKKAVELDPSDAMSWTRLLGLYERRSALDEAERVLGDAKRRFPDAAGIVIAEARLLRRLGRVHEAAAAVDKQLPLVTNGPVRPMTVNFLYEAGLAYDRVNQIDKAFQCFSRAKTAQSNLVAKLPDVAECRRTILHALESYTPKLAEASCPMPDDKIPAPVFLIGFPRSGTTLLDQILSSHPDVMVAEEKGAIDKAMMHFVETYGEQYRADLVAQAAKEGRPPWYLVNPCYPQSLTKIKTKDIEEMRRLFCDVHGIGAGGPSKSIFVDKLPLNILNAGFIKRLFPNAKFILALRHPCDSVLSCYMQQFQLNPYMARFLDLTDSARFYDEAFCLWKHYTGIFDLDVHTVRYEDVVADFRPTVAKLLGFLGVEWTDAVLKYDETAKKKGWGISTPSYAQVTEKIYKRATGRWHRYRKHLEPILPILAPWAERHGYSMDPVDAPNEQEKA